VGGRERKGCGGVRWGENGGALVARKREVGEEIERGEERGGREGRKSQIQGRGGGRWVRDGRGGTVGKGEGVCEGARVVIREGRMGEDGIEG